MTSRASQPKRDIAQALLRASREGDVPTAAAILKRGFNPNTNILNYTPLHAAAQYGHVAMVNILLAAGADPRSRDAAGSTPLHFAAENENPAVARVLLAAGASPGDINNNGLALIHIAADNSNPEMTALLLAAGADPKVVTPWGDDTSLHFAAGHGHTEVVGMLIAAGVDLTATNEDGRTALDDAIENGQTNTIELLRTAGASH